MNWSFESRNEIPSVPSTPQYRIWTRDVIIFSIRGVSWNWGLKFEGLGDFILRVEFGQHSKIRRSDQNFKDPIEFRG